MNSIQLPNYRTRDEIANMVLNKLDIDGRILCCYSGFYMPVGHKSITYLFNEEHIIPKLFFYNSSPQIAGDLHIIVAALIVPNKLRKNNIFAEIDSTDTNVILFGNAIIYDKLLHSEMERNFIDRSKLPHRMNVYEYDFEQMQTAIRVNEKNHNKTLIKLNHSIFPGERFRGFIARTIAYFILIHFSYLSSSEKIQFIRDFFKPSFKTLIEWDKKYPIQDWEHLRNAKIYAFQGNVNPLIGIFKEKIIRQRTRKSIIDKATVSITKLFKGGAHDNSKESNAKSSTKSDNLSIELSATEKSSDKLTNEKTIIEMINNEDNKMQYIPAPHGIVADVFEYILNVPSNI